MSLKGIVLLLTVSVALGREVFLEKEEAAQYLKRVKRDNNGFLEEVHQGNAERECLEEVCNYEEAREVFENDDQTAQFWAQLTDQCSFFDPCNRTGTVSCTNLYNGYLCACDTGFSGTHCDVEEIITVCEQYDDLCVNGGTCVDDEEGTYYCDCVPGWYGTDCAQDINECEDEGVCDNGTCLNHFGSYECVCDGGYEGATCSEEIDECEFGYCPVSSTCQDGINSFTCLCPEDGCDGAIQQAQEETP